MYAVLNLVIYLIVFWSMFFLFVCFCFLFLFIFSPLFVYQSFLKGKLVLLSKSSWGHK